LTPQYQYQVQHARYWQGTGQGTGGTCREGVDDVCSGMLEVFEVM